MERVRTRFLRGDYRMHRRGLVLTGVATVLILAAWIACPPDASSFGYTAASKAVARRILAKGINPAKFRSQARFGKKFYMSSRPSTALAEKGRRSTLLRMKTSKNLAKNSWDLRRPTPRNLRQYVGKTDFRGTIKRGVIGPKLGQRIGRLAERQGKAIKYRSVKNGGTNTAVPASLLARHPRSVFGRTIYQR